MNGPSFPKSAAEARANFFISSARDLLYSSESIAVRPAPIIAKFSGRNPPQCSANSAGRSLRLARSPEAPNITST